MKWVLLFGVLTLVSCASTPAWKTAPHDRLVQSVPPPPPIPRPPTSEDPGEWWLALSRGAIEPLAEALSPGTYLHHPEALDINAFGRVVGSAWFTPRLGAQPMSTRAIVQGHAQAPPFPGKLLVLGAKLQGVTPGLVVQDQTGASFVVKFDPPALPGMSSGAELIASRILHAAGWHVPETYLSELTRDQLVLSPAATTRGEYGELVPLTQAGLDAMIANVNLTARGTVRALFSKVLPGVVVGQDSFRIAPDYDQARIAAVDRRSLRGLRLFYAWLGNTDARDSNTVVTWSPLPENRALGRLTHYLLDFNDSLGASGPRAKFQSEGYEYRVDWAGIGSQLFSLGLYYHRWLPVRRAPMRAVGFFESEVFEPADWRPGLPNPAFDACTALDRYWAGSIIARFTPQLIAAIVREADYRERGAEGYITQTLRERQEKVLRWAFDPVLPLDDPQVVGGTDLRLADLAVDAGVLDRRSVLWRAEWDRAPSAPVALGEGRVDDTRALVVALEPLLPTTPEFAADPFVTVHFSDVERPDVAVRVHLRAFAGRLIPVALERDVD